ncbi:undecaprenyl-diphosphate phosphatase [Candidatus Woesearchaeota archaeon]|nr:undecaprenyl-diphosphate phosphatase [Candidatus Woesearchaeota archaeon]
MVSILEAIGLGVIQGITEWLPVSSSGHLVIFQRLLGITQPIVLDVFLHLGSLLVVFFVFRNDILKLIRGVAKGEAFYQKYFLMLVLGTIPIGVVGYFFKEFVEKAFESILIVGWGLLLTGILLFSSKFPLIKEKGIGWRRALVIGLGQAVAILPGVSRSGTTISLGLMQGVKREEAARFSFLLFIPAILGAVILEFPTISIIENIPALIAGVIVTILVSYFSLNLLLKLIKNSQLNYFGWYCFALGIIVLMFLA